ncbi:unnamed protein product [Polarella glacialis]|uniref:Uncharacterized protein n=1 Tax=Polarella glacialis TaxID=89957 RepID=A0A813DXZ7_POLGL|nr:unnamed protein product [Polarella glacialis]
MEDLEDFFPTVYGITLSTSSRTTEVVWVSRIDDKVLDCFPGKALTGRRVSASGPLLACGAATASESSRDSVEEEAPECAMKVDLAFLTLDAMTLSLPLGLAAQDPDLLRFTSAAGEELWPWRHSVLTAAEKFAGDGVATEPAPRRALVSGAAEAAGSGLQQITDGGSRRSALKASSKASAKKPPSLPPPSLGGAGGPAMREAEQGGLSQADLEVLAKILQGGQATKSKLQARPMTEKQLEEEAQDEAEVLEERAAPTMAAALVKLTEVLAAMQGRSSRSSLEETWMVPLCRLWAALVEVVARACLVARRTYDLCCTRLFESSRSTSASTWRKLCWTRCATLWRPLRLPGRLPLAGGSLRGLTSKRKPGLPGIVRRNFGAGR